MPKEKLSQARRLMDEGRYREARRTLRGVKGDDADEMIARLDEMDERPRRSSGRSLRDVLHVLLLALVFTAVFGGVGYLIASAIGIPTGTRAPAAAATGAPQIAAVPELEVVPQVTPTPTEIPCDTFAWWQENRAAFAQAVGGALDLSVETRPADVQRANETFSAWRDALAQQPALPCIAPALEAASSAAPSVENYISAFLTTTEPNDRAARRIAMLDDLLPLARAIVALEVIVPDDPGDAWVQTVVGFNAGECPAERWLLEAMYGRGYTRFMSLMTQTSENMTATEINEWLRELRLISSAFATDSPGFPECVRAASDEYKKGMDAFIRAINAILNNNMAESDAQLVQAQMAFAAFISELNALDPRLSRMLDRDF